MAVYSLILAIYSACLLVAVSAVRLNLSGQNWTVTNANGTIRVPAVVPGGVYTDLRRNGVLTQDPLYGSNDVNYRWVSYDNWTYESSFTVDESLLNKDNVYLTCHGLDTVSSIYINNAYVGSSENMFVRYRYNVKSVLRAGLNRIRIAFTSAVLYAKFKSDQQTTRNYAIPPICPVQSQNGECHPNFIRKMQSSFSWDWGPAFPSQGIWQPLIIEAYNTAVVRDIVPRTYLIGNQWSINLTTFLEVGNRNPFNGTLKVTLDNMDLVVNTYRLTPSPDLTVKLNMQIFINPSVHIQPWWPNQVGPNVQKLYKLRVTFTPADTSEPASVKQVKIGFRTIEIVQDPVQPTGLTFYFKVNGHAFYAKGSNWIPAHVFTESLTPEYIRKLLQSAKDANMNMLRVWGGGIYESNEFYSIADEMGILIWQDFMFACALYPTDPAFMTSVQTEIVQQVRRLSHHPSIALWAGNNENEAAIAQFRWVQVITRRNDYKRDYIKLYVDLIRSVVAIEDGSRPYVSSSPSNGLDTIREGWISLNPQSTFYGDVHHYDYSSPSWDWTIYPSAKFASEYGFQSYPSFHAWSQVTTSADWTYPVSQAVLHRQHHYNGDSEMETMIQRYLNLPSHGGVESFKNIIYLSQISQAMSIKTETEFYRRNREVSAIGEGFTMGALYWQLNDVWQAPTWASVEFGGKWKMLHYYAKNMFDNLLVSPYEDSGNVKVSLIRDDFLGSLQLILTVKVFKWSSLSPVREEHITVLTTGMTAPVVYQRPADELLRLSGCASRDECVLHVTVVEPSSQIYKENFLLLNAPKSAVGLQHPNLQAVNVTGPKMVRRDGPLNSRQYLYDIVIQSDAVAPFVWLDFPVNSSISGEFSDNGFLLFSGHKQLTFISDTSVSSTTLKSSVIFKSLTDVV